MQASIFTTITAHAPVESGLAFTVIEVLDCAEDHYSEVGIKVSSRVLPDLVVCENGVLGGVELEEDGLIGCAGYSLESEEAVALESF